MSIKLDLDATYDGMEIYEVHAFIKELKAIGLSDDTINELLERKKDK